MNNIPKPERAQTIVDLHRKGYSSIEIRRKLCPNRPNRDMKVVTNVLKTPDLYDTYIDQVAVDRAWMGDRKVWESMTHYERKAMMDRVFMFYDNDWLHPRFPGVRAVNWGVKRGFGFGGKRDESQGWIVLLAEELGEHPQRFLRVVNKRKQIRRDRSRANWADNLAAQ